MNTYTFIGKNNSLVIYLSAKSQSGAYLELAKYVKDVLEFRLELEEFTEEEIN